MSSTEWDPGKKLDVRVIATWAQEEHHIADTLERYLEQNPTNRDYVLTAVFTHRMRGDWLDETVRVGIAHHRQQEAG